LSDCITPFLKSNVAESVTVFGSPDASVGSVYSIVRISPCKIQLSRSSATASNLDSCDSKAATTVLSEEYTVVSGHVTLAGPSVYLSGTSISNIPASGAISKIGPNCLVALNLWAGSEPKIPLSPTSIRPVALASTPPAYPSTILLLPLDMVIFTGPTPVSALS
jgi:hypothetical protein